MNIAQEVASSILDGFNRHYRLFREISARAKGRFERAEWAEARRDARDRIGFYDQRVRETVALLNVRYPQASQEQLWPEVKRAYIPLLYEHQQPECAETFYNSVACRVLERTYYRNEYIFWRPAVSTEHIQSLQPTYRCYYPAGEGMLKTLERLVHDFNLLRPWEDLRRDLRLVALELHKYFPPPRVTHPDFQIQVLSSLFYRNHAAYVVGRAINDNTAHPFAVPILQSSNGELFLDALLLFREDLARLFSLGHAYFMVDMEVPSAYVSFLRSVLPMKPAAELYTAVGLQKQGKTHFYRDLHQHLLHSRDQFVLAPGTKGMVMLVFTLPSFPYVFKVIRDWFEPPKETSARLVKEKYLLVKLHERVGRMVDSLEYSDVALPINRFEPELLAEIRRLCPESVQVESDRVVLKHVYIEKRLVPLDVYLKDADEEHAEEAIAEYGSAIKDLAAANIFTGDILLKNFGVTRWGRVAFYDYDEICPLTDVSFRWMPRPRDDEEETAGEPWFSVNANDVFPEQFPSVLFRAGRQRELFLELHPELADPKFWQEKQQQIRDGRDEHLFAYPIERRFSVRYPRRSLIPAPTEIR